MEFFTTKQQHNNNNHDAEGFFFPAVDNILHLPLQQDVGVHGGEPQGSDMWLMFLVLRPLLLD